MPHEDGKAARIAALKASAVAKQQRAAENLDKAIDKLIQNNQQISFANVAREAGLSLSYLYKIPEVKERVSELRTQQRKTEKPHKSQTASEASKATIVYELRERIKKLEGEIRELRKINEGMAGRLYQLQEFQSLVDRFRLENEDLKSQLFAVKAQISPMSNLTSVESSSRVTLLEDKRTAKSRISDQMKRELDCLGIKLNSTLTKIISSAPESVVLNAIAALQEAISSGRIERPGGWLKTAIEAQWIPNEAVETQSVVANTGQPTFREWYDLAKAYGVIKACEDRAGVMMVQENTGQWYTYEDYVARGWTLDYFRQWKSRRR